MLFKLMQYMITVVLKCNVFFCYYIADVKLFLELFLLITCFLLLPTSLQGCPITNYYHCMNLFKCTANLKFTCFPWIGSQMTMFLSMQVTARSRRSIVLWSIVEVNDEEFTFTNPFKDIQARCFKVIVVSEDLTTAVVQ